MPRHFGCLVKGSTLANVHLAHDGDPTAHTPSKGGEYYDNCVNPACGRRDVDRIHKAGGKDGRGENHLLWSMFHCDRQHGGCGVSWTRTTPYARPEVVAKAKWHTRSAQVGTLFSMPSDRYRENFDQIDWSR